MVIPHVAGVAGLLRMYFPDCKAFQIRYTMIVTAKDKRNTGYDVNYRYGIVQAKVAFEYLMQNSCDSNELFKEPKGGCAEFLCNENLDCDDGNPDTADGYQSGSFQFAYASDAACDDGDACTTDTCQNGVYSSVLDCVICGGVSSVLDLTTDNYPNETSWDIKDSSGNQDYQGSGYSDGNTLHTTSMCLAFDDYTFTINDAYGDRICCKYGSGGYIIKVDGTAVEDDGKVADKESITFNVNASPDAPTASTALPPSICTQCTNKLIIG